MLVRFFREDQGIHDQPENPLKHHVMNWSENGSYALTSLNAVTFDNATRQWVENRTIPFVLMVKAFQANRTGRKILGGDNRSSSMTYCSVSSIIGFRAVSGFVFNYIQQLFMRSLSFGCWLRRLIKSWSLFASIVYVKINNSILTNPRTFNHARFDPKHLLHKGSDKLH